MVRKYHMWIVAGAFLMFTSGLAVAGSMERSDWESSYSQAREVDSENSVGAPGAWQFNEPVETGAVPDTMSSPIESGIREEPGLGFESYRSHPEFDAGGGSD